MPGPGRPPSPPLDLDAAKIEELVAQSQEFARDKGKLKAWLAPKRIFHVLFQDHLSTLPIPGGKGVVLNAQSSKLFLEMSEPLAAALEEVGDEEEEEEIPYCNACDNYHAKTTPHTMGSRVTFVNAKTGKETDVNSGQGRVDLPPQRPRGKLKRKPSRKNPR